MRFLTRIRRPRTGKRGISAGQRRESAERRVPLGGSLLRGAALEVPDDSLQAWPAASIAAFNGHGFLVRKPQYFTDIRSTGEESHFAPAASSWLRRGHSPCPPGGSVHTRPEVVPARPQ